MLELVLREVQSRVGEELRAGHPAGVAQQRPAAFVT
jgi:hypothetical protein